MKYRIERTFSFFVKVMSVSLASACTSAVAWAAGADVVSIDSPRISNFILAEDLEEMRREVHSAAQQLKTLGYLNLSTEAAAQFSIDALSTQFVAQDVFKGRLSFPYSEFKVRVNGFKKRGFLAASAHGTEIDPTLFNDVAVVYYHPSKSIVVTVRQLDQSALPSRTLLFAEFANFPLGKYPGSLVTRKASDGKSVSTLTWFTDRFRFEVSAGGYTKIDELEQVAKQVGMSIAKK